MRNSDNSDSLSSSDFVIDRVLLSDSGICQNLCFVKILIVGEKYVPQSVLLREGGGVIWPISIWICIFYIIGFPQVGQMGKSR